MMSNQTPFSHFVQSIISAETDFMPLLTFYGDDSGTHQSSRTVTVAGYVGQVAAWKRFSREWNKVLKEFGVQQMHRADLEAFGGEYKRTKGWNEERRKKFLQRLYPIIDGHVKEPIGSAVIVEDFESIVPTDLKNRLGGAYGWCANHCITAINVWCAQRKYNRPIQYVFEAGTAGYGQVEKMIQELYSNQNDREKYRIRGWSFQDKSVTPLQAADVLAYEGFKQIENQVLDKGQRPERISFTHLVSASHHHLQYWDRNRLLIWLESYQRQLRDKSIRASSSLSPAAYNRQTSQS
jgi:hypothetical protein